MAKRKETIIWSEISGALLEKDIEGSYKCPVPECHHEGFTTQRGCRKHVKVKHQWFIYFNEKPNLENSPEKEELSTKVLNESRSDTCSLPTFPTSCEIGEQFNKWLTSCSGGSKSQRQAHQILSRVFKFFKFCCEDEEELSYEVVDFSLSSPTLLFRFIDVMEEEWKLQHAGRLLSAFKARVTRFRCPKKSFFAITRPIFNGFSSFNHQFKQLKKHNFTRGNFAFFLQI